MAFKRAFEEDDPNRDDPPNEPEFDPEFTHPDGEDEDEFGPIVD